MRKHKIRKIFILFIFLVLLTIPGAAALEMGDWDAVRDEAPEAAGDILDGIEMTELTPEQAASRLLNSFGTTAGNALRDAAESLVLLLGAVLVCGMFGAVREGSGMQAETLNIAAAVAVTAITVGGMNGLIAKAGEAITGMGLYAKTLIPALGVLQAAMGQPGEAVARHGATMIFSGILSAVITDVLFPLTYVYILLLTVNAALPRPTLARFAEFIRKGVTVLLTASLGIFIVYFTISGAVAGSADAVALKSAQVGISTAVPVVGGILSDAAEAVMLGGGVIKNAIGLYGILAIVGICLEPFLGLCARWLMFKLSAALAGTVAEESTAKLLDGLGGAFSMVMGMTAASAFLLFISVLSLMLAGGAG
ncbi:MAG: stage III sporulation protein AE [Oscillospiraceae bacterium]|jgi:stage III sporulation protein AE|nr:stage III sporulation protein AE [Oscillospiraceae bacterium]